MIKPTKDIAMATQEIASRFNELAQQEKWFEIQDELFADNVRSIEPSNSPYLKYAEGKTSVRKKGLACTTYLFGRQKKIPLILFHYTKRKQVRGL